MKLPEEPDRLFLWPEPELWRGRRVATSHQSELFHAGIWVREFVLAELARLGWEAVYYEADAARCEVQAVVPAHNPLRVERRFLARGRLEALPAPSEEEWASFLAPIEHEVAGDWIAAPNLGRFLAGLRQRAAPHDLPRRWQSEWARAPSFETLVGPLLEEPERFREVFNQACREERARHRWRSRAHPFPELRLEEGRLELPLWWEGRPVWLDLARRSLWAGRELGGASEAAALPGLRPRAMLWAAFVRLESDLYLHGTGGAAYAGATDLVLRRFYGLEPPPCATVWLSFRLGLPGREAAPLWLAELTARLRELRYNPQRLLPEHPLAAEKERLVAELARAPRGRRAGLTRELQAVNRELAGQLEPLRATLEQERAAAALAARELTAAHFRGYSWLVVDPRRLQAISSRRLSARSGKPERRPRH